MMNQRHQLIFLKPDASFVIHSVHQDNQAITQQVTEWINKGLPCIYARQLCHDGVTLSLGLPVLLGNKKYRVGLYLNKNEVIVKQELPRLVDMAGYFAKKNVLYTNNCLSQQDLSDFQSISVYGSYLFEYLSDQPFVREHSDLDLLIDYQQGSLAELNQLIIHLKKKLTILIDGEVRFKNLGDIAFKELVNLSVHQLLFKNPDEIGLISRHDLYKQYPELRGV